MKTKEAKTSTKALKFGLAASVVGQALVPVAALAEETQEVNVELDITQQKDVDVVLTLGNTNIDATSFEDDLKALLQNKGVDSSRVNIESVEAREETVFLGKFSMNIWWPNNGADMDSHVEFWSNGSKIDEMFYGKKSVFGSSLDRDDVDGGVGEWSTINFETIPSHVNELRFYVNPYDGAATTNLRLIREMNGVKETVIDTPMYVAKPNKVYFGKLVRNQQGWDFVYNNGQVFSGTQTVIKAKKFSEVIRQPSWRDDAEHFIVNLENDKVTDFDNPVASGEILTRLLNEEINYVALGTSTNQQQALDFIQKNDGNGTYISNSDYQASLEKVADYIVQQLNENVQKVSAENPYLIAGAPVQIKTNPEQLATNTQTQEYPDGRWKLEHDETYFENNDGQSSVAGSYLKDIPTAFDKPGKYELTFADQLVNPENIFAHRRPVANFGMTYTKGASSVTVTTENLSYDPDNQSDADKGIAEVEWKWKETTALTWNDGQLPANLPLGKNYIVQLKVKDHQGVWSAPYTSYVTTDSSVSVKPVANFSLSANELTTFDTLATKDTSYDPAGKQIVQKEWTVKKENGTTVYTGANPVTNFNTYGGGEYTVSLRVKNEASLWSETFSRTIKVTEDKLAPEIAVTETEDPATSDKVIEAKFTDPGGSGLEGARYAVTNSNATPTSGWSEWSAEDSLKVDLTDNGTYYVHIEAKDKAGNILKRVLGPYEVTGIDVDIVNEKDAELSWKPVEEADSYRILLYKLNKETGEFESISFPRTASSTDYTFTNLTQGETYKVEIYPRTGAALATEAAYSAEVEVPVTEAVAPPKVQNVSAVEAESKIQVNWDILNVDSTDVTSYRVQPLVQDPVTQEFRADGTPTTVTTNSFRYEGAVPGKTYKFEVTPLLSNSYKAESAGVSNELTIAVPEVEDSDGLGDITQIPTLDITLSGTTATVKWDEIEGASQYRIQRWVKNTDTGLFVRDGFAKTSKSNEFVSTALVAGHEYKFEVVPRIGYVYDTDKTIEGTVTLEVEAPQQEEQAEVQVENAQVVAKGLETTLHWNPITVNGQEVTQYRVQRYKLNPDTGIYVADAYARTVSGTSFNDTYYKTAGKYRYEITPKSSTTYLNDKKVTIYNVDLANDDKLKVFFGNSDSQSGNFEVQRFVKGADGLFTADGSKFTVTSTSFEDTTADPSKEYKYTFEVN